MADLDEMRQRLNEMEKELAEPKKGGSERPGVVYLLPKEKKLRSFSGVEDQDVLSFIEGKQLFDEGRSDATARQNRRHGQSPIV